MPFSTCKTNAEDDLTPGKLNAGRKADHQRIGTEERQSMQGREQQYDPLPEAHYSPQVLAEVWSVSTETILRWFHDRPGVLRLSEGSQRGRRTRCEIRIPKSVAEQVYRERTRGSLA
jgi:hypothetical protein